MSLISLARRPPKVNNPKLVKRLVEAQELTDMNVLGSECEEQIDEIWDALHAAIEMASGYELRNPAIAQTYKWLREHGIHC